jgi:hypothetical protein
LGPETSKSGKVDTKASKAAAKQDAEKADLVEKFKAKSKGKG